MDITQFRRQYPQYDTLSDHDLAQRLHSKYYADRVDFDTFAQAFGVPAAPTVTVVEPPAVEQAQAAGRVPRAEIQPAVPSGQPAVPARPPQGFISGLHQRDTTPAPAEQPTDSLPTGPAIGAGEPSPVLRPFPGQPRTREQRARDFLDQIREDFTPQPEMRPEQPPSRVKRGLEQLFGRRGAVTPESSAEAILAAQAARHGMRPAQYAKEIGARTGLLERALEDLGSGAVGVGAGMLGYIARVADAEGLTVAAGEVQAQATDLLPPDPNFVDELLSGFGSTAMFFVPGMGIVRGATAVAQVAPRMAYWLGAGAAAGMEAATEAGLVYQERIDQGATPEEAAASADATFFANTPLLVVTNRLGLFADRGSRLMRRSLAGVIEGPGQEGPQQIISNLATGRPWDEGVLTSAAIGAIVGTTLGGARTPAEVAGDRFARGIERTEFEVPAEEVAAAMLQPPPREPDVASEADVADVLEAPTVDDAIEEAKDSVGVTTDAVEDVAQEQQVAAEQAAIEQQAAAAITPPAISYEPQAKQIADLMMQGRQDEAVALFEQTAAPLDETGVGELQARIQALRAAKERDAMTLETQRVPEDDTGPFPQPTNATQTRDQIAWNAQRLQSAERVAGERWPQAENVSDEERQAASNRARWLRQENESLRNLLRYYETPTTPQATPQPQEMVTPEEIPPAPREIPPTTTPAESGVSVTAGEITPVTIPPAAGDRGIGLGQIQTEPTQPAVSRETQIEPATTQAQSEQPAPSQQQPRESRQFEIGDYVEPVRDRDVLKPGRVTHVQMENGRQKIRLDGKGLHWYADDYAAARETADLPASKQPDLPTLIKQANAALPDGYRIQTQTAKQLGQPDQKFLTAFDSAGQEIQQIRGIGYTESGIEEAQSWIKRNLIKPKATPTETAQTETPPTPETATTATTEKSPDLRLRMLMLPEEVVEVEGTGERATVQESAAAAINRVDSKLEALYALRDCLRS